MARSREITSQTTREDPPEGVDRQAGFPEDEGRS